MRLAKRNVAGAIISIVICQLAGLFGNLLQGSGISEWYPQLKKPSFNPPGSVFAPVWISLYSLMGIAAFIVYKKTDQNPTARKALSLFGAQLIVNSLWNGAFFGLRSPIAGLVVIVGLWNLIVATIIGFWRVSPVAGLLMIPYLLWTTFAAVLNEELWRLNR